MIPGKPTKVYLPDDVRRASLSASNEAQIQIEDDEWIESQVVLPLYRELNSDGYALFSILRIVIRMFDVFECVSIRNESRTTGISVEQVFNCQGARVTATDREGGLPVVQQ